MKKGFFITGTDTNVGKTVTSAMIVSHFMSLEKEVGYWKPVQTGTDSDRESVLTLSGLPASKSPQPSFEYPEPTAPSRAALLHHDRIDLGLIKKHWDLLNNQNNWIVEGAGGLLVPLSDDETIADLAILIGLPLIIVASCRLGTINHLLLTLEAAKTRKLKVAGIIWVGDEDPGLEAALASRLSEIDWKQRIPALTAVNAHSVQSAAKTLEIPCEA